MWTLFSKDTLRSSAFVGTVRFLVSVGLIVLSSIAIHVMDQGYDTAYLARLFRGEESDVKFWQVRDGRDGDAEWTKFDDDSSICDSAAQELGTDAANNSVYNYWCTGDLNHGHYPSCDQQNTKCYKTGGSNVEVDMYALWVVILILYSVYVFYLGYYNYYLPKRDGFLRGAFDKLAMGESAIQLSLNFCFWVITIPLLLYFGELVNHDFVNLGCTTDAIGNCPAGSIPSESYFQGANNAQTRNTGGENGGFWSTDDGGIGNTFNGNRFGNYDITLSPSHKYSVAGPYGVMASMVFTLFILSLVWFFFEILVMSNWLYQNRRRAGSKADTWDCLNPFNYLTCGVDAAQEAVDGLTTGVSTATSISLPNMTNMEQGDANQVKYHGSVAGTFLGPSQTSNWGSRSQVRY